MKAVLALAFLAVANAAYPIFDDAALLAYDGLVPAPIAPVSPMAAISPLMAKTMFHKFGFVKPAFDSNFISFARSMGVSDFPTMGHMHALYDEPAVMFFMDPVGGIVSYFADAGIESAVMSPELRSVLPGVLGAADSMAIVYHPESLLGSYKSVLPGHFFVPSHSAMLAKIMSAGVDALPLPLEHVILKKTEIGDIFPGVSPIFAKFDIDEFPFAYKSPVALSFLDTDSTTGIVPSSALFAKSAFPGFGVSPFSPIIAKTASPLMSTISPAFMKSAFPLIRSGIPAHSAAFIPSLKFPLIKSFSAYEPLAYAKPALKWMHYPAPIASVSPISPISVLDAASPVAAPVADELRSFSPFLRGFSGSYPAFYPSVYPSVYPSFSPALRYAAPFYQSPIAAFPAAAAIPAAGATASSVASTSSIAGAEAVPLF